MRNQYFPGEFNEDSTLTGDYCEGGGYTYTNFEGRNPRHASETMREVSSYELEHGQPPR